MMIFEERLNLEPVVDGSRNRWRAVLEQTESN